MAGCRPGVSFKRGVRVPKHLCPSEPLLPLLGFAYIWGVCPNTEPRAGLCSTVIVVKKGRGHPAQASSEGGHCQPHIFHEQRPCSTFC